ncbi:MAG: FAD-dependent thymidylate synthase [Dehalococcoidia bacterium]
MPGNTLPVGPTTSYVLPNACETQIICTWNFREIRHIIKLRTSKRALPEMRAVAGEIRRIVKEIAPQSICGFVSG